MRQPNLPNYSGQPCKSVIADNIHAVMNRKELTASLSYLNKSCEFRKKYAMIVGEFEKQSKEEIKAYQGAYQKSDKYKAYKRAYYQRPEIKTKKKAYQKSDKYKAYQKAYYQRRKQIQGDKK